MPDLVPAVICYPHGWQDLLERGGAGAMWPIWDRPENGHLGHGPDQWQVCCPGCGKMVYAFLAGRLAILGGVPERRIVGSGLADLALTAPVTFIPCGCGTWDLYQGVWKFLHDAPRD